MGQTRGSRRYIGRRKNALIKMAGLGRVFLRVINITPPPRRSVPGHPAISYPHHNTLDPVARCQGSRRRKVKCTRENQSEILRVVQLSITGHIEELIPTAKITTCIIVNFPKTSSQAYLYTVV